MQSKIQSFIGNAPGLIIWYSFISSPLNWEVSADINQRLDQAEDLLVTS
jgi:hypothetical protein